MLLLISLIAGLLLFLCSTALLLSGLTHNPLSQAFTVLTLAIQAGRTDLWLPCAVFVGWVITACLLLILQGLYRFFALQALVLLGFTLCSMSVTVIIYTRLFHHWSIPLQPQFFIDTAYYALQHRDIRFLPSLVIGAIVWLPYIHYWLRIFTGNRLGKARMATGLDLYRAGFFSTQGVYLGDSFYGPLRYNQFEPIIFVAGTGGGKTKAMVIPNIFELAQESLLLTDIKKEIFAKTAVFRKTLGPVLVFDPEDDHTSKYNPLALVREQTVHEDLDVIFKVLIPDSKEGVWGMGSRSIVKMLTLMEIESGNTPTLSQLYRRICYPELRQELQVFYDEAEMSLQLRNLCGKCLSVRPAQFKDLCLQAQEYLGCFNQPNLAHATSGNDFNFKALRDQVTTIYITMPVHTDTYGSICALFFEQMFQHSCEENEPAPEKLSINCFIDEFANLPKIPSITKGINFLRSYRVRICAFVQHTTQIAEVYSNNDQENFLSTPMKVAFNVASKKDAEYLSGLCGTKTITVKNVSTSEPFKKNVQHQTQGIPLLRPDDIQRLSHKKLLLIKTGFFPAIARKNFWSGKKKYTRMV